MSNTIYNVVVSIINEVTGIDPESITLDSHIVDDLQIDSFAATEILGRFEEEFNITINATDFVGVYIISDIVDTLVELGATFDDGNIESYADTSDTAYLATEHDIFSNGSKRVLTYKNMLDLMYYDNIAFKASSAIGVIAPYATETFVTSGLAQTSYSTTATSFTIKTAANNYKYFDTGLTHYVTTATMTITMSISLAFSEPIDFVSEDEDETNYNVSPASLDFDNEGTQTSSVEDTGVAYTDNTMASTPNLMSAGNNTRGVDALGCNSNEYNTSCTTTELTTACANVDRLSACQTVTYSENPTVCDSTLGCGYETSGCACTDHSGETPLVCDNETSGCVSLTTSVCEGGFTYISYRATVYPINSNTAVAQITATTSVVNLYTSNNFSTTYIKIPALQYFQRTTTSPLNPFGFRIEIRASANKDYSSYMISSSTITYNRPSCYVFNPNNKTVRYTTAKTLYDSYMQDYT